MNGPNVLSFQALVMIVLLCLIPKLERQSHRSMSIGRTPASQTIRAGHRHFPYMERIIAEENRLSGKKLCLLPAESAGQSRPCWADLSFPAPASVLLQSSSVTAPFTKREPRPAREQAPARRAKTPDAVPLLDLQGQFE